MARLKKLSSPTMADDAEIKSILVSLGLYSLGLAYVGNEAELIRLFKDEFDQLVTLCQK
jgi:hypothetical protein